MPKISATRRVGAPGPQDTISKTDSSDSIGLPQGLVVITTEALHELVRDAVAAALVDQAPTRPVEREVVGPVEMARKLDCSRTTLHRLRIDGCPAVRLGDVWKYEPQAVIAWLKSRRRK